jgi:hypothetical protein
LAKFGLPPNLSRAGEIHLIAEQADESEKKKAALYESIGRFALGLLVLGFFLQLASDFV